jgi:hypothetical protein
MVVFGAGIYMMQEYCRLLEASATDLKSLGDTLKTLPADHPISGLLSRSKDFRRPEAMADALLHPQDRAYTVPEIYAWLDRCGLSFGRWIEQAPYLAQCGVLAGSPHASGLAALPSRLQHAAVELFRGTMVSHSFIAYRDDSADGSQPITFAGDSWRDYIPIRLPWTVCVRERLPPGSVAVLINQSHTFTDLICAVDSFEDRLLGAIDGSRTLGEILRLAFPGGDGESRALRFFERLWQYDQIVFDASRGRKPRMTSEQKSASDRDSDQGSLLVVAVLALIAGAVSGLVGALFLLLLERADRFRDAIIVWAHSLSPVFWSSALLSPPGRG